MSDIFHEVEEEVRRERYEKIWKEYGDYIIAAAAFIVIAAAGFQLWRYYEQRQQVRSSAEYIAAQQLLQTGQAPAAAEAFGKLASDAPSGYAQVARLQEAGGLLAAGRTDDAVKIYKEVANGGGDEILAAVARIRAAWAIVDTAPKSDVQTLLQPVMGASNAWSPMAREVLAYADFRGGADKQALAEYKSLATDKDAPPALHQRSAAMAAFLTAGGGKDYGTLPRPPQATTPPPPAAPQSPQGTTPK